MLIDEEFDEQQHQASKAQETVHMLFMFLWEVTISQDDDGRLARNNSPIL